MFLKSRPVLKLLALASVALGVGLGAAASGLSGVDLSWKGTGAEESLGRWESSAFAKLKAASSQEKDPVTGQLTRYKGVLLSQFLEKAMEGLSAERKAQVDLVVFKNEKTSAQVLLPRSVVTKYPVLLALKDDKISLIMPWTSHPKLMKEGLPVESYFISDVSQIELLNHRERFGSFFLKRRTDPLAMRGEKIFVQNCVGCHAAGQHAADLSGEGRVRRLASSGHPEVTGAPKLGDRERRALANYLDAFRAENP